MSAAFVRMATASASTKRTPAAVAGKIGAPVTKLTSLAVTPPMPATNEVIERYKLQSPREIFTVFAEGAPDVLNGDEMAISGITYHVRGVGPWPGAAGYLEIVLERVMA